MKKKIIISNWKLHGSICLLNTLLIPISKFYIKNKNISAKLVIMPPYIYLHPAKKIISNTNIELGAQNVDINLIGAFTGETSINMLKDVGVKYVLIGHSERRKYHNEDDEVVAKKFKIVKDANLIPILCIGETKNDYIFNKTKEVCKNQINKIFDVLGKSGFNNSMVAYEPRWAIGSNQIPPVDFIKKISKFIKNYILSRQDSTEKLFYIQYGGAVNDKNIIQLLNIDDIDGFLVGSLSLSLNSFINLLKNFNHT